MGQITEGSIDAQNIVRNLIDIIVGEVMKTINERTEPHFDSFENLKIQNFGDEEILICVKPERMSLDKIEGQENEDQASINNICYQNLPEVCIHSSTLNTQGEGDFQHPCVRETKAFYYLEPEGFCHNDQSCEDSYHSSVKTSSTDEIITQLHSDINNLSFDNIQLSDGEMEKELQTKESSYDEASSSQDGEETQVNQCCQTNSMSNYEEYTGAVEEEEEEEEEENDKIRHSPKFSQFHGFNQYFQLREENDGKQEDEKQELLSTSSEELVYAKSKSGNCVHNFSQTNPFSNPFLCSNVHSTIALSSNTGDKRDQASDSGKFADFTDVEGNGDNEWVEANEVQIRITEPGCSKHFMQAENVENDVDMVRTKQYWSNVGLITEHNVDRRYLGTVEIPGMESIKGVRRVEETFLTREPEEIIWVTEPEKLEVNSSHISSQDPPKGGEINYLSFPKKTEKVKKKRRFVSRLTKAVNSIFRLNSKDPKE